MVFHSSRHFRKLKEILNMALDTVGLIEMPI